MDQFLKDMLADETRLLLFVGIGVVAVMFVLVIARLRKRPAPTKVTVGLDIDLGRLPESGPPDTDILLVFYHVPVRLVAVIVAPVGRDGVLPDDNKLPDLVEHIAPGMMEILTIHQPVFRRCQPQLSSQGFTQAFFNQIAQCGVGGRGTPWCSIAGKLETADAQYLIGIVCRAASANSLDQVAVASPGGWLDVLRIKRG